MKAITLQKRLAKNNVTKNSKSYSIVKDLVFGTNYNYCIYLGIIRPCHTSGRGRFTTNLDYTNSVLFLLKELGIKYEVGNDAPRGSATGNFIKIITKIQF